jgi:GT2 family glycosyltransferase
MNPDVRVTRECLHSCAAVLAKNPDVAGVAPRLMRADGVTVDSVGQVLRRVTLEVCDRGYGGPMDDEMAARREVLAPCGALAVYRRRALDEVAAESGPFAEHFFCFWEDLELGWRLVNDGWKIITVPEAMAVHQRGAGARSGRGPLRWRRPPQLEACILTNRWMTLTRHLHARDLLLRLPLFMVWDAALVGAGVVRRPSLARELRRRMPLVVREWRQRGHRMRRRLSELPW